MYVREPIKLAYNHVELRELPVTKFDKILEKILRGERRIILNTDGDSDNPKDIDYPKKPQIYNVHHITNGTPRNVTVK